MGSHHIQSIDVAEWDEEIRIIEFICEDVLLPNSDASPTNKKHQWKKGWSSVKKMDFIELSIRKMIVIIDMYCSIS